MAYFLCKSSSLLFSKTLFFSKNKFFLRIFCAAFKKERFCRLLLEFGADPNLLDFYRVSCLSFFVRHANLEICSLLVQKGASTNLKNADNSSPLSMSISFPFDFLQFLLENDASANTHDESNNHILFLACSSVHNLQKVELLLKKGADVNGSSADGTPPISLACQKNDIHLVNLLLTYKPTLELLKPETALTISVQNNCFQIAKILVEAGANINAKTSKRKFSPSFSTTFQKNNSKKKIESDIFAEICESKGNDLFELFLAKGADVNGSAMGESCLKLACRRANIHMVQNLLERGAIDLDVSLYQVCAQNYSSDYFQIAKILLEEGVMEKNLVGIEVEKREVDEKEGKMEEMQEEKQGIEKKEREEECKREEGCKREMEEEMEEKMEEKMEEEWVMSLLPFLREIYKQLSPFFFPSKSAFLETRNLTIGKLRISTAFAKGVPLW